VPAHDRAFDGSWQTGVDPVAREDKPGHLSALTDVVAVQAPPKKSRVFRGRRRRG
jgi:hypothetical protein